MADIGKVDGSNFNLLDEGSKTSLDVAGGDFESMLSNAGNIMGGDSLFYLKAQQQMEKETQAFQFMSNIMKARDEAAKEAIRNIQ